MFHDQEEITAFDEDVRALHSLTGEVNRSVVAKAAGDLMRTLVSQDWPEWAHKQVWDVPDCTFNNFAFDDAEFLRRFIASIVTVLKSDGAKGRPQLRTTAGEYLRQRGAIVSGPGHSKPFRVSSWHKLFVEAKYSENESERAFRDWLKEQLNSGNAFRSSPKGAVSFDMAFLNRLKVIAPT